MSNVETVQAIYEAFGREDVPAILERLAEDVAWDRFEHGNSAQDAGLPYLAERIGRNSVPGFFQALVETVELRRFEPISFLEGDGEVAAVIEEEFVNRSTGKSFGDRVIHRWSFDSDGRVTALEHFFDTAKHIEAARA